MGCRDLFKRLAGENRGASKVLGKRFKYMLNEWVENGCVAGCTKPLFSKIRSAHN